jgi:hypothetical protein
VDATAEVQRLEDAIERLAGEEKALQDAGDLISHDMEMLLPTMEESALKLPQTLKNFGALGPLLPRS